MPRKKKAETEPLHFGTQPLEPHYEEGVGVVRVPVGTSAKHRAAAVKKLLALAGTNSAVHKYYTNYRRKK